MNDPRDYLKRLGPFTILALLILVITGTAAGTGPPAEWITKVDHQLLANESSTTNVEFLVLFAATGDLSGADRLPTKAAKGQYVYDLLRRTASESQTGVVQLLKNHGVTYRPYWIANMIWVRGDSDLIQLLAQRPDVAAIRANPRVQLDLPTQAIAPTSTQSLDDDILWNLEMVKAPAVWAMGFEGQGIVVGGQDTGYDWTHPALQPHYRGWDGQAADHNYNWHDAIHEENPNSIPGNSCGYDSPEPCDDNGHGTHTMGTMVGDDGQGMRTGVAPQAQWIGCRNMENDYGTPASYTECYEWFIAPYPVGGDSFSDGDPSQAPDVINNSWSCTPTEGCAPDTLAQVVEAVRAAGIVTVHSAGNSGSQCETINTPAALYDASFTVGAVGSNGVIASFSSRGPVTGGLIKPDVVAPGVEILSAWPNNEYRKLQGTSMAAPHVAGMVALLLSARPELIGNVAAIETTITQTAVGSTTNEGCGGDSPEAVPNNVYGWGLIDAEAAADLSEPPVYTIYTPFSVITAP